MNIKSTGYIAVILATAGVLVFGVMQLFASEFPRTRVGVNVGDKVKLQLGEYGRDNHLVNFEGTVFRRGHSWWLVTGWSRACVLPILWVTNNL